MGLGMAISRIDLRPWRIVMVQASLKAGCRMATNHELQRRQEPWTANVPNVFERNASEQSQKEGNTHS